MLSWRFKMSFLFLEESWDTGAMDVCIEYTDFFAQKLDKVETTSLRAKARLTATVDLPTPPLQLDTATSLLTWERFSKSLFFDSVAYHYIVPYLRSKPDIDHICFSLSCELLHQYRLEFSEILVQV